MTPLKQKFNAVRRLRPMMGTYVEVELRASAEEESLHRWISAGFDAISRVDALMSVHRPDSDVARINRGAVGTWIEIDGATVQVLQTAHRLYETSKGVFDVRTHASPDARLVGLCIEDRRLLKTGVWTIDLGGIAKGFAVDRAVEAIQRLTAGLRVSGTVNAGGDLRTWGPGSVPAAAQVRGQGGFWLRPFVVQETAAATSAVRSDGDADLTNAVHRVMPAGHPATVIQTVTVFSRECVWADALTKVVLMGSEKIARACLAAYDAKALIFNPNGQLQAVLG